MELGTEENGVNAGALQIAGECVEFASGIGQMPLIQLGQDQPATLDAHFETVQVVGDAPQSIVSLVETIEHARVGGIVKTMGAEEQEEVAQSLGSQGESRVFSGAALAMSRRSGRRGSVLRPWLGSQSIAAERCGV
jgi:hypothetical protein